MTLTEFSVCDTAHLSIVALAEATNATFAGYFLPITHTAPGFAAFCRANSVDLAQSVRLDTGAGSLAGLSMLAIRGGRGWCGGFGLVPEFRGRGLAARLVEALIAQARGAKLTTLKLEVLHQNEKAVRVYQKSGFQTVRELVILSGTPGEPLAPDPAFDIQPAAPEAAWLAGASLPTPAPCWQREILSLLAADTRGLVARRGGTVAGVLLYRPNLPAGPLAVGHLAFADGGAARALLAHARQETGVLGLFLLNEPEGSPLLPLLRSLGLTEAHRQHEMTLRLD